MEYTDSMNDKEKELFEERAAILEYDAGFPRDEAEKKAEEMIEKLRKGQRNLSL